MAKWVNSIIIMGFKKEEFSSLWEFNSAYYIGCSSFLQAGFK